MRGNIIKTRRGGRRSQDCCCNLALDLSDLLGEFSEELIEITGSKGCSSLLKQEENIIKRKKKSMGKDIVSRNNMLIYLADFD